MASQLNKMPLWTTSDEQCSDVNSGDGAMHSPDEQGEPGIFQKN